MSPNYRLILVLFIMICGFSSCTPAATPTLFSVTKIPLPATATAILPTATSQPVATAIKETNFSQVIWDKSYANQQNDMGEAMVMADDNGFYVIGTTNLDFSDSSTSSNIYLIRTDAQGEILWDKTYGGDQSEQGLSIIKTSDGNLLLTGVTYSAGTGGADAYLIKIDSEGNEIWSKTYGSSLDEMVSVCEMADGGFMLWGNRVDPADIIASPGAAGYGGYAGRSNIYLARIDAAGNELWSHAFGNENNLLASGGVATTDGKFMVLATLVRFPDPGDDLYLLIVDEAGNQIGEHIWEEGTMAAYDLISTTDDNYLIAGSYIAMDTAAKADFLFIKVNQQGEELWISTFGNPDMIDYPKVVAQTADGGYIAFGEWVKDWSGNYPDSIAVAKISAMGKPEWQEVVNNSSSHSLLRDLLWAPDGNYLLVGSKRIRNQFDIFLMQLSIGVN